MQQSRYTNVDELQAQMTLQEAATKCNVAVTIHGISRQVRLDCPFNCPGDHAGKREISVDTGNPQKVFACHAYGCQVRGNLLTLMHGWLTGTPPTGGKLKGVEFNRVRGVLAGTPTPALQESASQTATSGTAEPRPPTVRNIPLAQSDNEKARELETLDEKFLRDVAYMPPAAAMYVRRHSCLTPTTMAKWRVGVLPQDGGNDKRGWGLRGQLLYPVLAEDGKLLAWVARDPQFETKEEAFSALPTEQRVKEKKPAKHRFPSDFHRGLELFGQHGNRLQEAGRTRWVALLICFGVGDVIPLPSKILNAALLKRPLPVPHWRRIFITSPSAPGSTSVVLSRTHCTRMTSITSVFRSSAGKSSSDSCTP